MFAASFTITRSSMWPGIYSPRIDIGFGCDEYKVTFPDVLTSQQICADVLLETVKIRCGSIDRK